MFVESIGNTDFYCSQNESYFADMNFFNGAYAVFDRDCTFTSTLRALLFERATDGYEFGCFKISNSSFQNGSFFIGTSTRNSYMTLANISVPKRNSEEFLSYDFESKIDGSDWERLEKITTFFKPQMDVVCYINNKKKSVILFTRNIGMSGQHYLQCGIPAMMPWFFDQESGLQEEEMCLLNSLRQEDHMIYLEAISKIAEKIDFRTIRINKKLDNFERSLIDGELRHVENRISTQHRDLERLNSSIKDILLTLRSLNVRKYGLIYEKQNQEEGLRDYFLANKSIDLIDTEGQYIQFVARVNCEYFDEVAAENIINNKNSYFYSRCYSDEDMEMLMRAIFIDKNIKMQFCAAFAMNVFTGENPAWSGYRFDNSLYLNFLPNPHIQHYGCMGDYVRAINELAENNDRLGMIEQCLASSRSLNFHDSVVMNRFVEDLENNRTSKKCFYAIESPGVMMTAVEAINYLKEKLGKEEESNEQDN